MSANLEIMKQQAQTRVDAQNYKTLQNQYIQSEVDSIIDNTMDIATKLTESAMERKASDELAEFQSAYNTELAKGTFNYIGMNPENGEEYDAEGYWNNITTFKDNWLSERKGLFKGATKTAVNNYLSNTKGNIIANFNYANWDKRSVALDEIFSLATTSVFSETEMENQRNAYIAKLGFSREAALKNVKQYGISELYETMKDERNKFENGEDNNYYEASAKLNFALACYAKGYTEYDYYSKTNTVDAENSWAVYRVIQSAALNDAEINSAWDNGLLNGKLEDSKTALIAELKNRKTVKLQNGETVDIDGSTALRNAWDTTITNIVTQKFSDITLEQNSLYTSYEEVVSDLETKAYNGEKGGKIFYSVQDEIDYKNSREEYSGLRDSVIKASVDTKRAGVYTERSTIKKWADATATLLDKKSTDEQRGEAVGVLSSLKMDKLVSEKFNFGINLASREDDGEAINAKTNELFVYMKANKGATLADAVVATGFTIESGDVANYNAGIKVLSENLPDGFISDAYEAWKKDGDLEGYLKKALKGTSYDISEDATSENFLYKALDAAMTLAGDDAGSDVVEKLFKSYITVNDPQNHLKSDGSYDDEYLIAKKEIDAARLTLQYKQNSPLYQMGYVLNNSETGGAYDKDVALYMSRNMLDASVKSAIKNGDKDTLVALAMVCGDEELVEDLKSVNNVKEMSYSKVSDRLFSGWNSYLSTLTTQFEAQGGLASDYWTSLNEYDSKTSKGSLGTVEDDIKTRMATEYQDYCDSFLYMMYQSGNLTPGDSWNGVTLSKSAKQSISVGGNIYESQLGYIAAAKTESDRAMLLADAKKIVTPEAYKTLSETSSINLMLAASGVDSIKTLTLDDFVKSITKGSDFATVQSSYTYNDFEKALGSSKEFSSRYYSIIQDTSLSDSAKYDAVYKLLSEYTSSFVTKYNTDRLKANLKSEERSLGFTLYSDLDGISSEVGKDKDTKESSSKFFENLHKNSSSIKAGADSSDLLVQIYVNKITNVNSLNSREDITTLMSLATEMGSEASASYGSYAKETVYAAMAYSILTGTNLGLNSLDFTSSEIKGTQQDIAEAVSMMGDIDKKVWTGIYSSLLGIMDVNNAYNNSGVNDRLAYEDGTFKSERFGTVELTNGGSVTANVNGTAVNIEEYQTGRSVADIASTIFGKENVTSNSVGTGAAISALSFNDGGIEAVAQYNKTNETLKTNGGEAYDYAVIVTPSKYVTSERKVGISSSGYHGAYSNLLEGSLYRVENVSLDTVKTTYEYYLDKGLTQEANNLLSQLSDNQKEAVLSKHEEAEKKAKAAEERKAFAQIKRTSTTKLKESDSKQKSALETFYDEHKNDNTETANAIASFYEKYKDDPTVSGADIDKETLENIWIYSKTSSQVEAQLKKAYGMI